MDEFHVGILATVQTVRTAQTAQIERLRWAGIYFVHLENIVKPKINQNQIICAPIKLKPYVCTRIFYSMKGWQLLPSNQTRFIAPQQVRFIAPQQFKCIAPSRGGGAKIHTSYSLLPSLFSFPLDFFFVFSLSFMGIWLDDSC
jgi:hypothetical protein